MHHRPSGPPFVALLSGALGHASHVAGAAVRRAVPARSGRLVLGALLTATVVALVLALPVISGAGTSSPPVELGSAATSSTTATSSRHGSPVVMGVDGRRARSTDVAGTTASGSPAPKPDDGPTPGTTTGTGTPASGTTPERGTAPEDGTAPAPAGPDPAAQGSPSSPVAPPAGPPRPPAQPGTSPAPPPSATPPPTATPPRSTPPPSPATSAPPPVAPAEAGDPPATVLSLVNERRSAEGCGALAADGGLAAMAQRNSERMQASGVLDVHGAAGAASRAAAVAQDAADAGSVVAGWFADEEVSAVLLDCGLTAAGVGVVDGWWTTVLD